MIMKKTMLHFVTFLGLLVPSAADAATWYVKQGASGSANGTSWTDAFTTLQPALGISTYGDTIWVAKGTYYPAIAPDFPASTDPRDRTFKLRGGVVMIGGFAGTETTLAGRAADSASLHVTNATVLSGDINNTPGDSTDNVYHVVVVSGTVDHVMDGFTITGGNADGTTPLYINGRAVYRHYGGGIYNDSAAVAYRNVVVAGNTAKSFDDEEGGGAGMFNYDGSLDISGAVIIRNHAVHCNGGGMKNMHSSPHISNSYFTGNTALTDDEGGGAMDNKEGSDVVLTHVVFENNSTNGSGGGIYNDQSAPHLDNVVFTGNTAGSCGGGMDTDNGSNAVLANVTFHGNSAGEDGGGLYGWQSSATLEHVTFTGNHADNNGGGMYNYNTCNPSLTFVTFTGNTADNDYGGFGLERNSTAVLTNVLITRNTAVHNGGGMGSHDNGSTHATIILTNVTIANNTAASGGGGYDQGTTTQLRNSIVAGNHPDDVDVNTALVLLTRNNIIGIDTGLIYIANGTLNPLGVAVSWSLFVDTIAGNYRLVAGSPAIDAGDSALYDASATPDISAVTTDLRGAPRTMAAQTDLGAYEFCDHSVAPSVNITASPATPVAPGQSVTFTASGANLGSTPVFEWQKNSTAIAGVSGDTYTAVAGTDFMEGDTITAVVTSAEPCADPETAGSNELVMHIESGIASVSTAGSSILLYPNPGNGSFTIAGTLPQERYTMAITDAAGKSVYHEIYTPANGETRRRLDLSGRLAPGVYFLSLDVAKQPKEVIRFMVQ